MATAPAGFVNVGPANDPLTVALQSWLTSLESSYQNQGANVARNSGYSVPLSDAKAAQVAVAYPPITAARAKVEFDRWATTQHPGVFGIAAWNAADAVSLRIPLQAAADEQVYDWFRSQYVPGYVASVGYPLPDDKAATMAAFFRTEGWRVKALYKNWVDREHGDEQKDRSIFQSGARDVHDNPLGAVAGAVVVVSAAPALPLILGAASVVAAVGYGGAAAADATGVTSGAVGTLNSGAEWAARHPAEVGEGAAAAEVAVAGVAVGGAAGAAVTGLGVSAATKVAVGGLTGASNASAEEQAGADEAEAARRRLEVAPVVERWLFNRKLNGG